MKRNTRLELLHESALIMDDQFRHLHVEANEITAILVASGKTAKQNLRPSHAPVRNH
jgi:hypothetical protein